MLHTETNTPVMAGIIRDAARLKGFRHFQLDFEHGKWWLTVVKTRAQYSVLDAEGPGSVYNFDFEQVTDGDE